VARRARFALLGAACYNLLKEMEVNEMESTREDVDTAAYDEIESLHQRLGRLDPRQVAAWRAMSPARRLELAFQAYQFAIDIVRLTERQRHPDLSPDELAWRITRRMQGNPRLGR
jgi:hypothetical protein